MRLPESKIKEALLHPDFMVRQLALEYFGQAYRRDADLVPLVRQAVAQYGRLECFLYHSSLGRLTPSATDVAWIAAELQRPEPAGAEANYDRALVGLLYNADPAWVRPLAADLLPSLDEETRYQLEQYLQVADWDADRCWLELERMCGVHRGKFDDDDVDLEFATLIIARLARTGQADPQRVLDLLTQPVEEFDYNPMYWMETFAVVLAGELRLEAAVPMIVAKLHSEGDYLLDEGCVALAKIGAPAVVPLLTADFLNQPWDYRLYAAGVFDALHDDAVVARCLELLPEEPDADIRTSIAVGLVRNFAVEGVEPVRAWLASDDYDPYFHDVEAELCAAATLMGVTFPEHAEWKQRSDEQRERTLANMRAMDAGLDVPFPPTRSHAPRFEPEPMPEFEPEPVQRPAVATTPAGRNDPCPCGSGKKYKKCCLNR